MTHFILSGKNLQLAFPLQFLRMWFGKGTRLADISPEEFERALQGLYENAERQNYCGGKL